MHQIGFDVLQHRINAVKIWCGIEINRSANKMIHAIGEMELKRRCGIAIKFVKRSINALFWIEYHGILDGRSFHLVFAHFVDGIAY